jgi:type IV secretory pathway TraG/TraD family ATPase VirD4
VENAIIYFCLQPLAFPAYAECLGRLIINDIKSLAATQLHQSKPTKIYIIFDEFSVFAGSQVVNLINQGRSAGIHAILSTQSLSDLHAKGGDALVGQVLNNCNNYIIMRQNYHDDADQFALLIGTKSDCQLTLQVEGINGQFGTGSVREIKKFIIHPDAIKQLSRGEAFFLSKSHFSVTELCSNHKVLRE